MSRLWGGGSPTAMILSTRWALHAGSGGVTIPSSVQSVHTQSTSITEELVACLRAGIAPRRQEDAEWRQDCTIQGRIRTAERNREQARRLTDESRVPMVVANEERKVGSAYERLRGRRRLRCGAVPSPESP